MKSVRRVALAGSLPSRPPCLVRLMAISDDRLLDFNENTVGPRPLLEEEIGAIPLLQEHSIGCEAEA